MRELGHPQQDDVDHVLGVIKAFAQRDAPANAKLRDRARRIVAQVAGVPPETAAEALTAAEGGDLAPVHRLLEAVTDPFTPRPGFERYAEPGPADGAPFVTYCGT